MPCSVQCSLPIDRRPPAAGPRSLSRRQTAPSPCLARRPPLAAAPGPRAPANRWPALGTGTPPVGRALADARPAAGGRAPGRPPPCPGRGRTHGCCCCWCENDVGLAAMRESAPLCESIDSGAGRVGLCFPGGATAPQHWIGFTISLLPLPPAQIPPQFTNSRGVRKTANPTWAQVQALRRRAPPFGAAGGATKLAAREACTQVPRHAVGTLLGTRSRTPHGLVRRRLASLPALTEPGGARKNCGGRSREQCCHRRCPAARWRTPCCRSSHRYRHRAAERQEVQRAGACCD
jgi:hypothetical protein